MLQDIVPSKQTLSSAGRAGLPADGACFAASSICACRSATGYPQTNDLRTQLALWRRI